MLPHPIQNLINQFSKLPLVGPRQAARFVFHLIKQPKIELEEFAKAILDVSKNLKKCSLCFRITESSDICSICKDSRRDKTIICIIEKDTDIKAVERTSRYKGLYHILGGNEIKDLGQESLKELHLKELMARIEDNKEIKEIIIATSATTTGDTLALYISRLLKSINLPTDRQNIKITRLGRGLSTGSELEYMDEETLSQAFLARK